MGTLRSTINWSGREVNGVLLGDPSTDDLGNYIWDHTAIPGDWVDDNGDIWVEVDNA